MPGCKNLWEWFHLSAPVSRSFSTAINFPTHHHRHGLSMRPRVQLHSKIYNLESQYWNIETAEDDAQETVWELLTDQ
jgi:hypothetical protein